jgi:hypothetical protein
MKIIMTEQILVGNFAGENSEEQSTAAHKYKEMMESEMKDYCNEEYPEIEIEMDFTIENASGYSRDFEVNFDDIFNRPENYDEIENDIKFHHDYYAEKISSEIYED